MDKDTQRSKEREKEGTGKAEGNEVIEVEQSSTDQLFQTMYIEDVLQDPKTEEYKGGKEQPSTSFFRKPGPRSYKGKVAERYSKDSSAMEMDTDTQEISSSDSETTDQEKRRRGKAGKEEDWDTNSPPEKLNRGNKGPQRITSNRKRDRLTSEAESDYSKSRTTGEYVGRREAILKYNEAKEEALRLDREKIIREYSSCELFKKAKINLEKIKEEMEDKSIEELATKVSDNLTEVLRVAKSSSNLKGTFQKSLRIAAASSMGIFEVLKDKAMRSKEEAKSAEIKSLKREIAKIKAKMEEEVEGERRKALQAAGEAEAYKHELQILKKERRERRRDKTPSPKERDKRSGSKGRHQTETPKKTTKRIPSANIKAKERLITSDSEQMEIDEKPPSSKKITLDRPEEWPKVIRPTLCGKRKILQEDPNVQEEIYNEHKRYMADTSKEEGKGTKPKIENEENKRSKKKEIEYNQMELAELIRKIVAEELSRHGRKPIITEFQIPKVPIILERSGGKTTEKSSITKGDNNSTPRKEAQTTRGG
ncbi:PREDICTED: protein IWS1 homolog [Trachymyrmex cornetzi]|uniref:protein IWS1 homolog n=1 Tax=Trachymyrmex cornetzi TaxID=471704 RepID=UPI00084EF235|nr:PREDICTED: protein IWS1 homolog [Trachymyrmex cornetzi]